MAIRYIGSAIIDIRYRDRGDYAGRIVAGKCSWRFQDLHAPQAGLGAGVAYDSSKAYDKMAGSAVSFGSYFTSDNRGEDTPDWAPEPDVADAINDATAWAMDDKGNYDVRRTPPDVEENAAKAPKPRIGPYGMVPSVSGETWLENEVDGRRRARVRFPDGSLRVVDCEGVADTFFSVSCRAKIRGQIVRGYVTVDQDTEEFIFRPSSSDKGLLTSLLCGPAAEKLLSSSR
jgi:hypothetical protein